MSAPTPDRSAASQPTVGARAASGGPDRSTQPGGQIGSRGSLDAGRRTARRTGAAAAVAVALALTVSACTTGSKSDAGSSSAAPEASATPRLTATTVDASESQLDEIVNTIQQSTGIPGIAVGVVHDGGVVIAKGYGVAEAGTDQAVTPQTVFQLASLSKPIGSSAVAAVVGRGDIAWDQPVSTELPDFRLSDDYVTRNATLADFYSHRTGLPGDTAGNDLETIGYSQEEILPRLRSLPLKPFRATYSYSNFGMTVGGLAAAKAYGAPFAQMAEEVLFEPAGMTSTSFSHADFAAQKDAAKLHARVNGTFVNNEFTVRDADAQAPAGGASSNIDDLNRWMLMQLGEGQLDGRQIVDAEALAETKRPHINRMPTSDPAESPSEYGLGWNVGMALTDPALVEWSHSGAFSAGAGTTVKLLPEVGLGVVVLTNAQPTGAAEAIAETYADVLLNGSQTREWAQLYGDVFAGLFEMGKVADPASAAPPKEDAAYVGTYANDYFGDVVVRKGAQGLEMAMGPGGRTVYPLTPFDGDTFTFVDSPELEGSRGKVAFQFADGSPVATSLALGPAMAFGPGGADATWTVLPRR